jgi:cytochrome c oxidase cbb3-type subunit 4
MYRQFYEGMDLTHLPMFTLVLFILIFAAAILRTFVFRRAGDFDHLAHMPLSEGSSRAEGRHE